MSGATATAKARRNAARPDFTRPRCRRIGFARRAFSPAMARDAGHDPISSAQPGRFPSGIGGVRESRGPVQRVRTFSLDDNKRAASATRRWSLSKPHCHAIPSASPAEPIVDPSALPNVGPAELALVRRGRNRAGAPVRFAHEHQPRGRRQALERRATRTCQCADSAHFGSAGRIITHPSLRR
jgi:hypothetical protein